MNKIFKLKTIIMKNQARLIKAVHETILDLNEKLEVKFTLREMNKKKGMLTLIEMQIEALKNERDFWESKLDELLNLI